MAVHNKFGKHGEELAVSFLINSGYDILHCNWRFQKAEVDIVCQHPDQPIIVFVEVKSRTGIVFGRPEEFVSENKQRLYCEAAENYMEIFNHDKEIRFDVISVVMDENSKSKLYHIPNAFGPVTG